MKIIELGCNVTGLGGVNRGNAGDTAISSAFEYLFERDYPNAEIEFMNCRKIFDLEDIAHINQADLLVVAGGGLLLRDSMDKNGNKFETPSGWSWGITVDLLKKIKIPIMVQSIGFNKFRGHPEFNQNFVDTINYLVFKSIHFSMRNHGSIQALKKYLNPHLHSRVKYNPCPTIELGKSYHLEKTHQTKIVSFNFAGDRLELRHQNISHYVREIKMFIDYLRFNNYKIHIVNHLSDTWILDYLDHTHFDLLIDLYGKPAKEIYEYYAGIDVAVSDRGHGLMIPYSVGCKIISPVSHDKLKWFLSDVDLSKYGIEEYDKNLGRKLIEVFNN